jgi:FkbM family methyltransferase
MRPIVRLLEKVVRRAGYELRPLASQPPLAASPLESNAGAAALPSQGTMAGALRAAAERIEVRTVIDVGASDGSWSLEARKYFSQASFFLIEAQADAHEPHLHRLREQWPEMDFVIAAAGNRAGSIHFLTSDPLGGQASETPYDQFDRVVPMVAIDDEVSKRALAPPFLIKLDTHGFEVPIFEGAQRCLEQASLLVVEVYNFEIGAVCLRFHELCAYLERRGFRCIDLVDVMHRPKDGLLWQFDLFFARSDRPEFTYRDYR